MRGAGGGRTEMEELDARNEEPSHSDGGTKEEEEVFRSRDLLNTGLWSIERDARYGRYLVATRDLLPGEVILAEMPLMWGPNTTSPVLVCLGCFRHMVTPLSCPSCQLPLCSPTCSSSPQHAGECALFTASKEAQPDRTDSGDYSLPSLPYPSLLALRLLLLADSQPSLYRQFRLLASLLPQWRAAPGWLEGQDTTLRLVRDTLGLQHLQEEEILQVLATCCTNTFSKYLEPSPGLEGAQGTTLRVSYLLAAMPAHSCLPNTEQAIHSLADGLKFELRATRPIARGEQITITYTELLAPTAVRQFELLNSKLFLCSCRRCADPSELGSGASAVRCSSCLKSRKAGLLQESDDSEVWQCDLCGAKFAASTVLNLVFKIYEQMEATVNNPAVGLPGLEAFLAKYSRVLGPQHGCLLRVRYSLCGQYGRIPGYELPNLSSAQLARKQKLCTEMIAMLERLQPGRTSRRALILYEQHVTMLMSGQAKMGGQPKVGREELGRGLALLREALDILRDEPPDSFGGQLYLGGLDSLPQVEQFVTSQ